MDLLVQVVLRLLAGVALRLGLRRALSALERVVARRVESSQAHEQAQRALVESTGSAEVIFAVEQTDREWPTPRRERLRARPVAAHDYEIVSAPFFVLGVSVGDVVEVDETPAGLVFSSVVHDAGHSTLQVRVTSAFPLGTTLLRAILDGMGCATEEGETPGLFSVDVPPHVPMKDVLECLDRKGAENRWVYRAANISDPLL